MQKHDWKITKAASSPKEPTGIECRSCGIVALRWFDSAYRIQDVARALCTSGHPGVAPESTVFEHCEEEEVWKVMKV